MVNEVERTRKRLTVQDRIDIERPLFKDDRCHREAHIPAKQAGAETPPWLPRSDGDQKRPPSFGAPARKGP
jgi:hypothetical protein